MGLALGFLCAGIVSATTLTASGQAKPAPAASAPSASASAALGETKIEVKEKVQFEQGKAVIRPESDQLLKDVADIIKKSPYLKKVSIEGHASGEGDAKKNKQLSEDRAKAVMNHLVKKEGIDASRLVAKGWGSEKPVAADDSEANREKNRRVEFVIVEQNLAERKAAEAKAAPAAAPVASGPAVPIPEKPAMDGATYAVRLRDLEARVDELKDQIRRSHTRLALLSDTILSGGAAGSRAEVIFKNEMSSAFRLTRALVIIDGAVQYNRQDDTGALADQKEIPIFNGSIPPGDHTVQMKINLRGNGYGVFTYLRGYNFEVTSAHSFTAVEGKQLQVIATALEKGGVTTPLEQRPQVQWEEKIGGIGGGTPTQPAQGGAPVVKTDTKSAPGSAGGSISVGGGK
ncbi:MAG: OmpA family protein [Deltaproteobacteria bacterium]|nr:OmpA family protein [Deltaproteobacteria bacterium]